MPAWTAFASVAGVVTVLLLLLSHATSKQFVQPSADDATAPVVDAGTDEAVAVDASAEPDVRDGEDAGTGTPPEAAPESRSIEPDEPAPESRSVEPDEPAPDGAITASGGTVADVDPAAERAPGSRGSGGEDLFEGLPPRDKVAARDFEGAPSLSAGMVFVNVALSQGVFGLVLVVAAIAADVPGSALGLGVGSVTWQVAVLGVGFGVALYAADEAGAWVADSVGVDHSEGLRDLLAPERPLGWVLLLGGVLPIVAAFEELLFRGILIGAFATGFGVSPWLLVVGSSLVFGLGHGAQGRLGVLVTAALGVVLGTAFVVTGSLLLVVVAHYVVNALEFVVHEGLGVDWHA